MSLSAKAVTFFLSSLLFTTSVKAAELKHKTVEAFNRYVSITESRMSSDLAHRHFLWIDGLPEPQQKAVYARLLRGDVVIEHLETQDDGRRIPIPSGLEHHWVAVAFIRGATLPQTVALLQDYNHQHDLYQHEIMQSKLLKENGGDFSVYLRLYYKVVVHVVYNANFDVQYTRISPTQELSRSVSTRIADVADLGEADEHEKPVGNDRGFLWRLYTYGRYEQKDGGTYMEVEFISLSWSVPAIFAWVVKPYLKKIPTEYLTDILESTRTSLTTPPAAASQNPAKAAT